MKKMKKFTKLMMMASVSLMAVVPVTAAIPAESAHAAVSTSTYLYQGMHSSAVTQLQRDLKTLGYFSYGSYTNYFGSVTAQGVKRFQAAYNLAVDGIVGPATATAINRALVKKNIVADSYNYMGVPYVWGGKTPSGFDCSGFITYLFNKHGVNMPYAPSATMATRGAWVAKSDLKPGDLVFFSLNKPGVVGHAGIYVGNGQFISATSSKGIAVYALDNPYWAPKYITARRAY